MSKTLSDRIAEITELADATNARMDGNGDGGSGNDAGADQTGDKGNDQSNSGNDDYPADLGDAGKRAIDRMKAERDEANRKWREAESKLSSQSNQNTQQNDQSGRNGGQGDDKRQSETKTPDQIRDEVSQQIRADNDKRVLRSDVRRLAEGRLTDSNHALRYLDLSDLSADSNGEFDQAAITSKIDKLLEGRPYLAAASKPNFQGGADGGNRGDSSAKSQLGRDDLKNMSYQEINQARIDGRLKDYLSGKS